MTWKFKSLQNFKAWLRSSSARLRRRRVARELNQLKSEMEACGEDTGGMVKLIDKFHKEFMLDKAAEAEDVL